MGATGNRYLVWPLREEGVGLGTPGPPRGPGSSLHAFALGCSIGQAPKALAGPERSWLHSLGALTGMGTAPLGGLSRPLTAPPRWVILCRPCQCPELLRAALVWGRGHPLGRQEPQATSPFFLPAPPLLTGTFSLDGPFSPPLVQRPGPLHGGARFRGCQVPALFLAWTLPLPS